MASIPVTLSDRRKFARLPIALSVEIASLSRNGKVLREETRTRQVSKTGALLESQVLHEAGNIYMTFLRTARNALCRVVWSSCTPDSEGCYMMGVEILDSTDFWPIHFPAKAAPNPDGFAREPMAVKSDTLDGSPVTSS